MALDSAEHMGLERGLLRHWPQAAAYEDLLANPFRACLPCFPRCNLWKLAGRVEVFDRAPLLRQGRGRLGGQSSLLQANNQQEQSNGRRKGVLHIGVAQSVARFPTQFQPAILSPEGPAARGTFVFF